MTKKDYILNQCKDGSVLDLGCVQSLPLTQSPDWLHKQIKEVASFVVGVDNANVSIKGYHIIRLNVENLNSYILRGTHWDTIVAGDIIEHLFNAGLFLDGVKSLDFDKLIITTPNVMSPKYWMLNEHVLAEHTCWYSMKTLTQLVEMKGFNVVDRSYGFDQRVNGLRPLIKFLLYKLLPQTGNRLLITIK